MKRTRVLVVDDSPTMRAIIRAWLERDGEIAVVGEAGDPHQARAAIKALSPDVLTLDVNMPRMDGLEFLEKLMRLRPTPVIMVSSEVGANAAATIEALAAGAFDCVCKPANGNLAEAFGDLALKVKAAARAPCGVRARGHSPAADFRPNGRVVAIGASTGGVDALMSVLSAFPANCPPTVVVQHMPASFTRSFAQRLDQHCAPQVAEAWSGAALEPGRILIAPGGPTHLELRGRQRLACRLTPGEPRSGHRPSVDVLFASAAGLGARAVGVILTGMGRDGAEGLLRMREAGACTIGQDAGSSLVYGMPRAAAEAGGVQRQLDLHAIPAAILAACSTKPRVPS
jgi:two-component system, chemotaxis family, protein-glutamate methylesterase/glutaminase